MSRITRKNGIELPRDHRERERRRFLVDLLTGFLALAGMLAICAWYMWQVWQ